MRMQDEGGMRRDTTDNNEEEDRGEVQGIPAGTAADIRPIKPTRGLITEAHMGQTKKTISHTSLLAILDDNIAKYISKILQARQPDDFARKAWY